MSINQSKVERKQKQQNPLSLLKNIMVYILMNVPGVWVYCKTLKFRGYLILAILAVAAKGAKIYSTAKETRKFVTLKLIKNQIC